MSELKYIDGGDVRNPIGFGTKLICHVVNDKIQMGAGVALALLKKWPAVRDNYIAWGLGENNDEANLSTSGDFGLGEIQTINVDEYIFVVNMVAQHGIGCDMDGNPPIRYDALKSCLEKVRDFADLNDEPGEPENEVSVHVPFLMGCDLALGNWSEVEQMLKEVFVDKGWNVFVYDLFNKRKEIDK